MNVFVYGTLTDPDRVAPVVSDFEFVEDVSIDGLHRVEGEYPTLAPGGSVDGRLLRTPDVAALDAYEGVDRGLYVRVSVPLSERDADFTEDGDFEEDADVERGDESVAVYVGDPDELAASADWPGVGSFAERVREYVRERDVVVRRYGRES